MRNLSNIYDVEAQLELVTKKFHSHKLYYEYMQMLLRLPLVIQFSFSKSKTQRFLEIRELHQHLIFLAEAKNKLKYQNPIQFSSYLVRG